MKLLERLIKYIRNSKMKDEISQVFLLEFNCVNYTYKFEGSVVFNNPKLTFLQLSKLLEKYYGVSKKELEIINSFNAFKRLFNEIRDILNNIKINKFVQKFEEMEGYLIKIKVTRIFYYKEKDL